MTKQEFLAMSLPYGLKCCTVEITRINDLISCHFGNMVLARVKPNDEVDFPLPIEQIKPILRPLSDLTKPIEHKGEKFVPINRIKESQYHLFFRDDITSPLEGLQFSELRKLIEWHFDIADLISKGEAIDVNTLEVNPYK